MIVCKNCGQENTKIGNCTVCLGRVIRTRRGNPEIAERRRLFRQIVSYATALGEAKKNFERAGGKLLEGTPGTNA